MKIQDICQECNVQIKFPERGSHLAEQRDIRSPQQEEEVAHPIIDEPNGINGAYGADGSHIGELGSPAKDHSHDVITISGRAEKCQLAKEKLEVSACIYMKYILLGVVAVVILKENSCLGFSSCQRSYICAFRFSSVFDW